MTPAKYSVHIAAHGSGHPQERQYNNVGTSDVTLRRKRLFSSNNNADVYVLRALSENVRLRVLKPFVSEYCNVYTVKCCVLTESICVCLVFCRTARPLKTRKNIYSGQNTSRATDLLPTVVLLNKYRNLNIVHSPTNALFIKLGKV